MPINQLCTLLREFCLRATHRSRYVAAHYLSTRPMRMRNTAPLVSFSFDDFPTTAWTEGGAILSACGIKATYYVSLGLMARTESSVGPLFTPDTLAEVADSGHELGCHTFDHTDAWYSPSARLLSAVERNSQELFRLLPQTRFRTFAFPKGRATSAAKRVLQTRFECCRGTSRGLNLKVIDLNLLRAVPIYGGGASLQIIVDLLTTNRAKNGWLIFYTHDITKTPSRFGTTPRLFDQVVRAAVSSGARVLPISAALNLARGSPQLPGSRRNQ